MKFDKFNIAPEIKINLHKMGLIRTTDIQFKTIPAIMAGEDVLAIAQTGTGKTAAFAIPVINRIHFDKTNKRSRYIKCLVMVPTRELAKQIGQVFASLSKNTRANSYAIYGGVEQDPQISQLIGGVDILIATPGRMFDLIHQAFVDVQGVEILILDEADHMLDLGFIKDIEAIKTMLRQHHQTLFFSATINPKIKKLAYSQVRSNALRIQVSPEKLVSKNITHNIVKVEMDDKRHLLVKLLQESPESKVLVFVRTQVRAERVQAHLTKNQINSVSIHGGKLQSEREASLEEFRNLTFGVLIATDVSARGIDLPGITHVINYDIPDDPENYVHRVGRTGRGFAKGQALSFCSSEEKSKLGQIEEFIQTKISKVEVEPLAITDITPEEVEKLDISEMISFEESLVEPPKKRKKKRR